MLSAIASIILPQAFNRMSAFHVGDLPIVHTPYLLHGKLKSPSSHCVLFPLRKLPLSLSNPCSLYSIPIKMSSRNGLKLLHGTNRAKSHQRLEQLRLLYMCLFLIWQGALPSVLFMGWGRGINSARRIKIYQEQQPDLSKIKNRVVFLEGWVGESPKGWTFFLMCCQKGMELIFWSGWRVGWK